MVSRTKVVSESPALRSLDVKVSPKAAQGREKNQIVAADMRRLKLHDASNNLNNQSLPMNVSPIRFIGFMPPFFRGSD
jgi:hypothetical protein